MADTTTPAKRATKKAPAKKIGPSAQHKAAMAKGRSEGNAVRRYLEALKAANAGKRRGRKKTPESIEARIASIDVKLAANPNVLLELQLKQERSDAVDELEQLTGGNGINPDEYAPDFVKVVKGYSERKGIDYGTWREMGVPAELLKKAGVPR